MMNEPDAKGPLTEGFAAGDTPVHNVKVTELTNPNYYHTVNKANKSKMERLLVLLFHPGLLLLLSTGQ